MYKDVSISFDIMFVNKIAFIVAMSRYVQFGTTEQLESRLADVVGKALVRVIVFYSQRGFCVKEFYGGWRIQVPVGQCC